jgi:anti-anti-sigma factor
MEITRHQSGDALELRISGRLDAYWADHLANELKETVRGGSDRLRLDLSGVDFLSSAGLRVLLVHYRQLLGLHGSLVVVNPSEPVRQVLELAGFEDLLVAPQAGAQTSPTLAEAGPAAADHAAFRMETFALAGRESLSCRVVGRPDLLTESSFTPDQCRKMAFPASHLALGLGAFGSGFEDSRHRFGEFLAVGGSVAYLPTDGTNVPDYMSASGAFVPEVQMLYGLDCVGRFSQLARFEAKPEAGAAGLSALAAAALDLSGAGAAGIVMVAESAGLVGAALRRSPALGYPAGSPFRFPEVRQWLSFTPERAYARSLALVVGVVARCADDRLGPLLRPLGNGARLEGHLHAAVFSYRPLQRGEIDLETTVAALFQGESLQGVLHLLHDDRPIAGAGESEFVRGACWLSPITSVS